MGFSDFLTIFEKFCIFGVFMDFLDFYWIVLDCFGLKKKHFLDFLNFLDFFGFSSYFFFSFKVTKVTTKCYRGYYWTPKIAKNGPKQHKKLFFLAEGQKMPWPKAKAFRRS